MTVKACNDVPLRRITTHAAHRTLGNVGREKKLTWMESIGEDWTPRLKELYTRMDETYGDVVARIGFSCVDCDGSKCCEVDLILHTYAERLYLRRGFYSLSPSRRREVIDRCLLIVQAKRSNPFGKAYRNSVCAMNFDGLCAVYAYRPMICRLAGVRHFFNRPDGRKVTGPGCPVYENIIAPAFPDVSIDRTEFYRRMASVEIDIVNALGERPKPMTIAEILSDKDFIEDPSL